MLNGSSALQHEPTKQITTPTLRVKLKSGNTMDVSTPNSKLIRKYDAFSFLDKQLIYGITDFDQNSFLETWDTAGSKTAEVDLGFANGFYGDFVLNGSTVEFYYKHGVSNTYNMISSGDAETWGSPETVYTGATFTLSDLAVVTPERIYFQEQIGSTVTQSIFGTMYLGRISVLKDDSGWGATTLYSKSYFYNKDSLNDLNQGRLIAGYRHGDLDHIVFPASDDSGEGVGLRQFSSEGVNTFDEHDIVQSSATIRNIKMTNAEYSNDKYYLGFQSIEEVFDLTGGITNRFPQALPPMLLVSHDMRNWSSEKPILGATRTYVSPVEIDSQAQDQPLGHVGVLVSGATSALSTSVTYKVDATEHNAFVSTDGTGYGDVGSQVRLGSDYDNDDKSIVTGLRLTRVAIPPSATITSAKALLSSNFTQFDPISTVIYMEDVDDSEAFTSGNNPDDRTQTTAGITWNVGVTWAIGETIFTSDFKDALQEVVDRGGWESENSISILIHDNGSGNGNNREFVSYDGWKGDEQSAELHITYTNQSLSETQVTWLGVSHNSTGISSDLQEDIHINQSIDSLDVSDNITSYTNNNNERVTLTLANS